jgi:lysozyme family protein
LGVTPDGALGPITRRAVEAASDLSGLIEKTVEERRKSVRQFRNFDVFGKGWMNRINNTEKAALEMSRG